MLQSLFEGSTLPLLEKAAVFGERRQDVLAANIANIDTPNYKTRDLPVEAFQEALRAAVASRQGASSQAAASPTGAPAGLSLASMAPAPTLEQLFPEELFHPTESPKRNLTFQDANNRSIEAEFMEMTKNNMMQNFAVELLHAQMNLLQSVIREQA
jgi:flagellar basal-body rod protein FlgB